MLKIIQVYLHDSISTLISRLVVIWPSQLVTHKYLIFVVINLCSFKPNDRNYQSTFLNYNLFFASMSAVTFDSVYSDLQELQSNTVRMSNTFQIAFGPNWVHPSKSSKRGIWIIEKQTRILIRWLSAGKWKASGNIKRSPGSSRRDGNTTQVSSALRFSHWRLCLGTSKLKKWILKRSLSKKKIKSPI